jgi:RimJ/RimL family protein N-acetyltransferase
VIDKNALLRTLPLRQGALVARAWTRQDLDRLAAWPPYPFPYRGFEFRFAAAGPAERDAFYRDRQARADALVLVVDHRRGARTAIGYIAPRSVDWETGTVGNVGVRVHPVWCGQGVGTESLRLVTRWSFEQGMARWRLDVAACNERAVRCYGNVGFVRTGELWRDASHLAGSDWSAPRYDFLWDHLRERQGQLELRFWVMELVARRA